MAKRRLRLNAPAGLDLPELTVEVPSSERVHPLDRLCSAVEKMGIDPARQIAVLEEEAKQDPEIKKILRAEEIRL